MTKPGGQNDSRRIQEQFRNPLMQAADHGDLCLMECRSAATGEPVMVICAVNRGQDEFVFVPIAKLFDGNPYEEVVPPTAQAA